MGERRYVEPVLDEDGFIIQGGYTAWDCTAIAYREVCGAEVRRYRGERDVQCSCGQWYNACGQRLRNDWMGNQSNWDSDVSDMDGFEAQHQGDY